jgi:glycosyltransferase involved in cell wall biosynthesis
VEPTVSIVIPTFNRSALLLNAIESALQQTYDDNEIIVVDDGSTDDTATKLVPYLDRIRYVYQNNRGVSAAQNKGIELARGRWISILASDDVWLPTKLERQFTAISALGGEFGACFTDCAYMGNPALTRSAFEQAGLDCSSEFTTLDEASKLVLARYPALYVQSMLVLRSMLDRLNRFDERLIVGEDTDVLFRLSFVTRFCAVREPLVKIDRTPGREIGLIELFDQGHDKVFDCVEQRYRRWLALPELTDSEMRADIVANLRLLYYGWAIARLYELRFASAFQRIRHIRRMGDSYPKIAGVFAFRAARKLLFKLGWWRREPR